jgi:hypothetical protein
VQSGVQSENNRAQLRATQTSLERWITLGTPGSLRLGAGRSQVQILSPRLRSPWKAQKALRRCIVTGCISGCKVCTPFAPRRDPVWLSTAVCNLRPHGSEPGGRRLATTQALPPYAEARQRPEACASGAAPHREQAKAVHATAGFVRSERLAGARPDDRSSSQASVAPGAGTDACLSRKAALTIACVVCGRVSSHAGRDARVSRRNGSSAATAGRDLEFSAARSAAPRASPGARWRRRCAGSSATRWSPPVLHSGVLERNARWR